MLRRMFRDAHPDTPREFVHPRPVEAEHIRPAMGTTTTSRVQFMAVPFCGWRVGPWVTTVTPFHAHRVEAGVDEVDPC